MRALVIVILILTSSAGCLASVEPALTGAADGDQPLRLVDDDFYRVAGHPGYLAHETPAPFHTLEEIEARILGFQERRPDLVRVDVIGESWAGRPIHDVVVTNLAIEGDKPAPFFDGGHHANEILGVELALYTIDLLLDNYDSNATVRHWVDTLEIHTVPLVNPDGYVVQTRGNALGVNLNRNYDVDWGNPLGANNFLMGTLAHATGQPMPSVMIVAENSGSRAFSEPETQAMRDRLSELDKRLAFYMTYHTPTNGMIAPWAAFKEPFQVPPQQDEVLWGVLDWVRENTEYKAGKARWGDLSAGLPYSASGSSMDWAYMRHNVPAFTLEIEIWYTSAFSDDFAERILFEPYLGLEYWLLASLPVPLHLLVNAQALAAWEMPIDSPPLPEGVPPPRDAAIDACAPLPSDEHPLRPVTPLARCPLLSAEDDHAH